MTNFKPFAAKIYSNDTINKNNPVHIEPYFFGMIKYYFDRGMSFFITPKIDGTYAQIYINNILYECEILNNYAYIFNKLNRYKYCKDNFNHIEKLFKINIIYNPNTFSEMVNHHINFCEKIYNVNQNINDIMAVPKIIFEFNKNTISDSDLSDIFYNCDISYFKSTDGWILYMDCFNFPLKMKPFCKLTIDVPNQDGEIWRNYMKNNEWKPYEKRTDKKAGNCAYIIRYIENRHISKWKYVDIWKYFIDNPVTFSYYSHTKKVNNSIIANKIKCYGINKMIYHINKFASKLKILDLGCGNGSIIKKISDKIDFEYYGIDNDVIKLSKYPKNANMIFGDINNLNNFELFTSFLTNKKFDIILMNNSLHFISQLDSFVKLLKKYCCDTTIIINDLFTDNYKNKIICQDFIIENKENIFQFNYAWNANMINEKLYATNEIIDIFTNHHFKLITKEMFIIDDIIDENIKMFVDLHYNIILKHVNCDD